LKGDQKLIPQNSYQKHIKKLLLDLTVLEKNLQVSNEIAPIVFIDIKQIKEFVNKFNLNPDKNYTDEELRLIYFYAGNLEANIILMLSSNERLDKRDKELAKSIVSIRQELDYVLLHRFRIKKVFKEVEEFRRIND